MPMMTSPSTSPSITLLIETSSERGIIAFGKQGHLLDFQELPFGLQNSHHLMGGIERLLKKNQLTPRDFQAVAVGAGPGSYTGIRVGVAAAKSIAYALKIPLISLCSLTGFIPENDHSFAVFADAKSGGIYFAKGRRENGAVSFETEQLLLPVDQIARHLGNCTQIITPKNDRLRQRLEGLLLPDVVWEERYPDSQFLIEQAWKKLQCGEYSADAEVNIHYLRHHEKEIG